MKYDFYTAEQETSGYDAVVANDTEGALDVSETIARGIADAHATTNYNDICVGAGILGAIELDGFWRLAEFSPYTPDDTDLLPIEADLTSCSQPADQIVCYANASFIDPSLLDDAINEPTGVIAPIPKNRRALLERTLTGGPSETYVVQDISEGTGNTLNFTTPTYPNRENGAFLTSLIG